MTRLISLSDLSSIPLPDEPPCDLAVLPSSSTNTAPAWDAPIPLGDHGPPPKFPVTSVPPVLAEFSTAWSTALSVPIDLVAMLGLGTVAACVQRTYDVQIRPAWIEPTGLYIVVVLPPASRKSAAFSNATKPLTQWERTTAAAMSGDIAAARAKRRALEKARDRADNTEASAQLARELDALDVPQPPRVVADDTTPEKLTELLATNAGIAVVSAEGTSLFDSMGGRYRSGNGTSYGVYLQAHAGDRVVVDRINRESLRAENPRLTVVTTTQPDALQQLGRIPNAKGLGLLGRFQYVLPESTVGRRPARAPAPPSRVVDAYAALISALLDGHALREDGSRRLLTLSPEADDVLAAFQDEIEPRLSPNGDLAPIADWAGKLSGAVARIAANLHVVIHAHSGAPWLVQIAASTVRAAVELGRYLLEHACRAFDVMETDPAVELARILWARIVDRGWMDFSVRDLHSVVRGRRALAKRRDLDEPLALLVDHHYIRPLPAEKTGPGRRPERYARNPEA